MQITIQASVAIIWVDRLWPVGQIRPTACFCIDHKERKLFHFEWLHLKLLYKYLHNILNFAFLLQTLKHLLSSPLRVCQPLCQMNIEQWGNRKPEF